MKNTRAAWSYLTVVVMAVLLAFNYHIFIVTNNFAPAGLNGFATMIQYKLGFSISYMYMLINVPLSIFAYFCIQKEFAAKTFLFAVVYSTVFYILQNSGLEVIQYNAGGTDTIYPVIISGVIAGFVYGNCIKNNACTGGNDIISRYVNKVRPDMDFFKVSFVLNAAVAIVSIFVYSDSGLDYKPAALCITYCFISSFVGNYIIKGTKTAYKFTIITEHPDEIIVDISTLIKHGVTKMEAVGSYTNTSKTVLLCVVNKHQLSDVKNILFKYGDTFSFYELVNETYGNFKFIK